MNKSSQQELWEKIQTFSLDDPASSFPFSKKLAKENNWYPGFANAAIEEYRKFIFLCCISPTGASPSYIVDQVWHMHLTYTDNYWNQFCKNTLQKEIHHHPSKGGTAEHHKHTNWYADTLLLYEEVFGIKPPPEFWPATQESIPDSNPPVYDSNFFNSIVLVFITAIVLFILATSLFSTAGKDFLKYYMLLCIAGIITTWFTQTHKAARLKQYVLDKLPTNFTTFQITRFIYGPHRCYQTAIIDLLKRGIIETKGNGYKLVELPSSNWKTETNPLLQPLLENYSVGDPFTYLEGLGLIETTVVQHPGFERLLQLSKKVDYQKFIIPGIVLLIGIARFFQGIANGKPVTFLIMEMGVFGIVSLMILEMNSYTKLVKNIVEDFWEQQNQKGNSDNILNNFSIMGPAAIAGFAEYAALTSLFDSYSPQKNTWGDSSSGSSSSGCSSSCGSGCGGGGCGGCGS